MAVIDIGTHTLLLLVAEITQRDGHATLLPVHDACEFGRLGRGLEQTGELAPESIERSLAAVQGYRKILDELDVDAVAVVGTQALREAKNAREFVDPAMDILGVPIEIIAGEREAALVFRAVAESFPDLAGQRFVVADVGGGSTEIIVGAGDPVTMESFASLPIGSVRLHERHLRADPPTPEQVQGLIADIDSSLDTMELPGDVYLVGTAGTATTIGTVELKLRMYDPDKVHGLQLPVEVVERQLARHLELTVEQRRHVPGLVPQRADVIAAGVAIYARLLHRLEARAFIISDRGVRWGLAYELASR